MSVEIPAVGSIASKHSEQFNAQNADITFKSSNGFLFHIHRKNVEANTGGFAPPGLETYDEAVQLTEEASTLDLLFSFIYPKCQPTLVSISFITLARLAEAVEKYEVYSAMNICQIHMQNNISKHPAQTLEYAVKHNYHEIIIKAVRFLLDLPLDETVMNLPQNLAPWSNIMRLGGELLSR